MKILKHIITFFIGMVLYFTINVTFMFQSTSLIFVTATLLYLTAGIFVQFKYFEKQKNIITILLLVPQILFAILIFFNNKNLFPIHTPGILCIVLLNYFLGFLLVNFYIKLFFVDNILLTSIL